jgi:hypothetical protein
MARTIKTTTEDFRPNEFIDLVESVEEPKTFIVENKNGVESRVIENNIERVNIQNIIEEGRYEVSRELKEFDNSENKPTNVSSKYEPILFSETLLSLRKTGVLRTIENEIEKVKINFKDGDVKIFFNQQNLESDVLDIFNNSDNPFSLQNMRNSVFGYDDFSFDRKDFGDYNFVLNIQNSFDRKRAIGFFLGTYRLICSNGLVIPQFELGHIKKRHFSNSKDKALSFIEENVKRLPMLVKNMKDDSRNDFIETYNQNSGLTRDKINTISKEFVSEVHDWKRNKEKSPTFHKNMTIKKSVNSLHNTFTKMFNDEKVTENISNLFDISNIFSYFTSDVENTKRFTRTTNIMSREVDNIMRKVIERV